MDVTQRFSDRVTAYTRGRPGYPAQLLDVLALPPAQVVCDLGSGTGLLSRVFLEAGHLVHGVEPNPAMRAAGEAELATFPAFHSHAGRAEETGLEPASVDLAVAGQAFHWFEPEATRRELERILRGPRRLALIWNDRNHESPLERDFLALMEEFAPDFRRLRSVRSNDEFVQAFIKARKHTLPGHQDLDLEGLRARIHSCSCMPGPGEPRFEELEERIQTVFARHQQGGRARLTHTTRLYWGRL